MIVDKNNRIVDTGYNGPPRNHWPSRNGESCAAWCPRAIVSYAQKAHDLVIPDNVLTATYENCDSLHAEQNALMFSDRRLREGGKIYVSSGVCGTCAKLIANSGLAEVVYEPRPGATHRDSGKWVAFMEQCGLTVVEFVLPSPSEWNYEPC